MACTIVSTPATGAADWTGWITQQGLTDRGFMRVSLTEFATTAASLIAAGSIFELAGSIYSCTETAISLATGTASADVAVYYVAIPSAGGTVCTFVMDDNVPTWIDAKQGYYASAASTSRYLGGAYIGTAATYYGKWIYNWIHSNSKVRVTKNDAQSIANASAVIVQYDDEIFDNLGEFASYTFTAIEAGYYFVSASLQSASKTWATGEYWELRIYKNGVFYSSGRQSRLPGWTGVIDADVIDIVQLAANEYIDIRCYQTEGAAVNTGTIATSNFLAIHRLS